MGIHEISKLNFSKSEALMNDVEKFMDSNSETICSVYVYMYKRPPFRMEYRYLSEMRDIKKLL